MKNNGLNDKRILIEFLGLPGGGKTTTAYLLRDELEKRGKKVLYFPDHFLQLNKTKRHILPIIYALPDPRIWKLLFLYFLVLLENFKYVLSLKYFSKSHFEYIKTIIFINFKFLIYKKHKNKIDYFLEDESEIKQFINRGFKNKRLVKKIFANLIFLNAKSNINKKLFIYFKVSDIDLLVNRVNHDQKRKKHSSVMWGKENKDNLIKYYQRTINRDKELIKFIKEKIKDQNNLHFLEVDGKDDAKVNVEIIIKYLEEIND